MGPSDPPRENVKLKKKRAVFFSCSSPPQRPSKDTEKRPAPQNTPQKGPKQDHKKDP